MAATDEQYGNKGYGQIGAYNNNPYDQRDESQGGDRYNNYAQGRYDDRASPTPHEDRAMNVDMPQLV